MEARRPYGSSVREAAARDLARADGPDAPVEIVDYDVRSARRRRRLKRSAAQR